jgi:outer membrane protein OmpA-like peptidoglycan-associated protein
MIRLFISLIGAFLLSNITLSAQVKKCFKLLDKMEFEQAFSCFQSEAKTPGQSIATGYGLLKSALGSKDRNHWTSALSSYEKTLQDFNQADESVLKKSLAKDFNITKITLEAAFSDLFGKNLEYVEQSKNTFARDSFMNVVPAIPQAYKTRFNRLMIEQKNNPAPSRQRMDPGKKNTSTPVYVDRKAPEGSRLEFIKGVNTAGSELIPIVSSDGNFMYFLGVDRTDNYIGEDVFYSERQPDGSWGTPRLDAFFSGPSNEAVVSMSSDGNVLVLFIGGKPHLSKRTSTGWSEPAPIRLQRPYAWIGVATITRNGEALIFEAKETERSDMDLFIAFRKTNGNWDLPFGLGSTINTPLNDRMPFLHSDFKTLYFSSEGHGGQGSFDIFKTTRLDDTWKNWSVPENLGPNVNTSKNELGFYITPAGNVAYLATTASGFGDQDIMRIALDAAAQPEAQVVITGTLTDGSGKTLRGEITVEDAISKKVLQTVATQPNGKYAFSVPKTAKINYYATGDSLISTKKTYIDASSYQSEVAEEKVEIVSVKEAAREGKALELKDLQFDFAKSELRAEAQTELKRIYANIKGFNWAIEIGGHTDNVGTEQSNLELSTRRAQSVRDFLVSQGYPAEKITFKGYGQSIPLDKADTEKARARNRRVEIKVKKQ